MSSKRVRILIVDDQNLSRLAMEEMLNRHERIEVLGGAANSEDAISLTKRRSVDVILINSLAHNLNLIEATKKVATLRGDDTGRPRVLVLSNEVDEHALAAIAAGASGVVLTSITPEELVSAIMIADIGYLVLPPDCRQHSIIGRPINGPSVSKLESTHHLCALTERENDILRLLAVGLSNSQISTELMLSESTVKSHVQHVLNKLSLPSRVHAVILAYELGLIQIGQNAPQLTPY